MNEHNVMIRAAISRLAQAGYRVTAQDLPGLWRINGGPELTTNQMLGEARRLTPLRPFRTYIPCPQCAKGEMHVDHSAPVAMAAPPLHLHRCSACGHEKWIRGATYPRLAYVEMAMPGAGPAAD